MQPTAYTETYLPLTEDSSMEAASVTEDGPADALVTDLLEMEQGVEAGFPQGYFTSHMLVVSVIGILGLLGNGLVLVVFYQNAKLRTPLSTKFIISQAIVDFIVSLVIILQEVIFFAITHGYLRVKERWMCKVFGSGALFYASTEASTLNLVLLTANRYIKVVHQHGWLSQLKGTYLTLLVCVPGSLFIVWSVFSQVWTTYLYGPVCVAVGLHKQVTTVSVCTTALFFLAPAPFFCICGAQIVYKVMETNRAIRIYPDAEQRELKIQRHKKEVNILKTIVLVCLAYFLCWMPVCVLMLLRVFLDLHTQIDQILVACLFLAFFNCCINPIIYSLRHKDFSKKAQKIICGCKRKLNAVLPSSD